jgi:replicative DNA helicase
LDFQRLPERFAGGPTMTTTRSTGHCYQSAAEILPGWRDEVLSGQPPTLYPVGEDALSRLEIGPGHIVLIGGGPGSGKTALTMQLAIDALRLTRTLKAAVCNVEMPPNVLLDRQLARLSGVPLTDIRYRRLDAYAEPIGRGIDTLDALANGLAFVRPPYTIENVTATAEAFGAKLLLLDYIQRIEAPGEHADRRGAVDASMSHLRQLADDGLALIVVSAVGRSKDASGRSTYSNLGLASFRESSELEFGADDAFILEPTSEKAENAGVIRLKHVKSRHGEMADLWLNFDGRYQDFTPNDRHGPAGLQDGDAPATDGRRAA